MNHEECINCHNGLMEKPYPAHSYDFHPEGYILISCNNCGRCHPEFIPVPKELICKISNQSIEVILRNLCNGGRYFSYGFKKHLYQFLKDKNLDIYELAEQIVFKASGSGYMIDWGMVINTIYTNVRFSS